MLRKQFFLYYVAILVAHTVFWCAIKRYDIWEQLLNDKLQSTIEPNCLPTISHFSLSQLVIISLVIFGNIGINMNTNLKCMHLCINVVAWHWNINPRERDLQQDKGVGKGRRRLLFNLHLNFIAIKSVLFRSPSCLVTFILVDSYHHSRWNSWQILMFVTKRSW